MSASHGNDQDDEKNNVHFLGIPPAVVLAILAVALTIISVLAHRAEVHALIDQGQGSDILARYHTSVFQQDLDRNMATIMRGMARGDAKQDGLLKDARILEQRIKSRHAQQQRKLLARGAQVEQDRDEQLHKHHTFQLSEASLDLAIVVASLAILIGSTALEAVAVVMGLASFAIAGIAVFSVAGLGM